MTQGVLSFKYEEEKKETGMTALGGLPVYLDLASVMGIGGQHREAFTPKEARLDGCPDGTLVDIDESCGRGLCGGFTPVGGG